MTGMNGHSKIGKKTQASRATTRERDLFFRKEAVNKILGYKDLDKDPKKGGTAICCPS